MARRLTIRPGMRFSVLAIGAFVAFGGTGRAQISGTAAGGGVANAVVAADSLAVYPQMNKSRAPAQSLSKGDKVIIDLEIQAIEKWCSVRLPSQAARLGYVECHGLQRLAAPVSNAAPGAEAPTSAGARTAKPLAKDLRVPLPAARAISGYDQIATLAVHDGNIDTDKITEFDAAAQAGSPDAMSRAALAHFAAGNFELKRSSIDEAVEQFQTSLRFSVNRPELQVTNLLMLAGIDVEQSQYSAALEYLETARRLAPRSAGVAQLSGWAHYGLNQIDDAITEWQTAQEIQPNADVARSLEKAKRDKAAESDAGEVDSSHFTLRYQGSTAPQLAKEILATLENDFRDLQSEFRFTPAEPIGVVLYTEQSFREVADAPAWAEAGNDGRIRVPVQGLASVSGELSRVLEHELVHSFIRQKTLGRCPTWLNEGLAEWFEGRRTGREAATLVALFDKGQYIPLEKLEGPWSSMSGPTASYAYAWSLAAVEYIMSSSGMFGIERLFARFDLDPNFEAALRVALQTDYADLERQTAAYLRQPHNP